MSSMYEQAYNQYLKMEGSSFVSPEKPKSLGGRPDVKVAEAQINKIGATNIAIYERFSAIRKENKIGRNEPCHCGSGKKYKKCCL